MQKVCGKVPEGLDGSSQVVRICEKSKIVRVSVYILCEHIHNSLDDLGSFCQFVTLTLTLASSHEPQGQSSTNNESFASG